MVVLVLVLVVALVLVLVVVLVLVPAAPLRRPDVPRCPSVARSVTARPCGPW